MATCSAEIESVSGLVRERDLVALYEFETDLDSRGSYFPLGVRSQTALRAEFDRNGLWDRDEGLLLITTPDDEIVGEIEFFPITHYLVGYEISYQLFDDRHAGRGYTSEAVKLLVDYLFGLKRDQPAATEHPSRQPGIQTRRGEVRLHLRRCHARRLVPPRHLPGPGDLVAAA